jgi:uncharacterized protein YjlB
MLASDDCFPNNPQLPLLVYRGAVQSRGAEAASELERLFAENCWGGAWRDGIFSYHHFHSNAHEVLGICAGSAEVQFGGPQGPILSIEAGDVAILPAGAGHKRIASSGDLLVVGAYPAGQEGYDLLRGDKEERIPAEERIAATPLPGADPVYGKDGPLLDHWTPG